MSSSELLEVAKAMRAWIDAVPSDVPLPAMPGFDRDWADSVIEEAGLEVIATIERNGELLEASKLLNISKKCAEAAFKIVVKTEPKILLGQRDIKNLKRLTSQASSQASIAQELTDKAIAKSTAQ